MSFASTHHLDFAKRIKNILLISAFIACLLVAAIGITTWLSLQKINQQVKTLVNETAVKTSLLYDMRISARERNLHIALSLLATDPLFSDMEWAKAKEQGSLFLISREKFKQQNPEADELTLINKQQALSKHAVKLQYQVNEYRLLGERDKAIKTLHEEISFQIKVFSILDELLDLQKAKNRTHIENIFKSQKNTKKTVVILTVFIFTLIYLISTYLIKQVHRQAREIKNEGIKYKALIDGSIDGILVLEKTRVINCNLNALKLFGTKTLDELNKKGLDYFSQFADDNKKEKQENIFSAINYALINSKKKYEWKFRTLSGNTFPTEIELQNIELDEVDYIQMIIRDISEREEAQQALRDANENLEKKIRERTEELKITNTKMLGLARSAGMSEVASGVLHNVGNVLNSVNVSASVLKTRATESKLKNLEKIVLMLNEHENNLYEYLANDESGKLIIPYIEELSKNLTSERDKQMTEIDCLIHNVDHIKNIISMQQAYTGNIGVIEKVKSSEVANDAININISSINNSNINLNKLYNVDIEIFVDKHKLIQILVNLISNAIHAVVNGGKANKEITFGIQKNNDYIIFYVEDNGIGISADDIERVFEFGFKKRPDGHGYGLHHSALVAKELGGELVLESDGLNKGAKFTLRIPIKQA